MAAHLKGYLQETSLLFQERGIPHFRHQAEELFSLFLEIPRLDLHLHAGRVLSRQEFAVCQAAIERRLSGEPLQYIRGVVEFLGCFIHVNRDVLIPRQETEILAAAAIAAITHREPQAAVFWDLCTGSGCVGIAVKKSIPVLDVVLSDLSAAALEVAKRNAAANEADVAFAAGDLLEPFRGKKADAVFCNPPYIAKEEYDLLDREVKEFEPEMALVAERRGLAFYERLAKELPQHLNPGAAVWLECGYAQGEEIRKMFNDPVWKTCRMQKDWAGHDRFFFLEME